MNNCSLLNYKGSEELSTQRPGVDALSEIYRAMRGCYYAHTRYVHLENLYLIRSVVSFDIKFKSGFNTYVILGFDQQGASQYADKHFLRTFCLVFAVGECSEGKLFQYLLLLRMVSIYVFS